MDEITKETEDKIKEGTLKVDHDTDAMTVVLGKEKELAKEWNEVHPRILLKDPQTKGMVTETEESVGAHGAVAVSRWTNIPRNSSADRAKQLDESVHSKPYVIDLYAVKDDAFMVDKKNMNVSDLNLTSDEKDLISKKDDLEQEIDDGKDDVFGSEAKTYVAVDSVARNKFYVSDEDVEFPIKKVGSNDANADEDVDLARKNLWISNSVFATNFPDHFTARDLWNVCNAYSKVIDVYIPLKKSKVGKIFAFVHFIKVDNLDCLIGKLCTIWIGRLRLHANPVRFQRETRAYMAQHTKGNEGVANYSFALVLKTGVQNTKMAYDSSPTIVLDDSCIPEKDMSCILMGKIKDINALSNLYVILANEGFEQVNLTYLGGFWVLIDTGSTSSKEKMRLPMRTWTRNTFAKIVSPWDSLSEVEDEEDSSLPYKNLCVITKPYAVINNKIKVIVKGHVYWIRVKELEAWSPDFNNYLGDNSSSGDLSEDEDVEKVNGKKGNTCEKDKETEVDHVSESGCMNVNGDAFENNSTSHEKKNTSKDPFGIYKILNRKNGKKDSKSDDPSFPPGFTPVDVKETVGETNGDSINQPNEDLQTNHEGVSSTKGVKMNLLSLNIQGLGQSAKKSWTQEIYRKHKVNFVAIQETKMKDIGLFSIKALWGNFSYDFVFSPSVRSSRGILCVWGPNLFNKDNVTILDYFVAVRGTWVPTSTKLLIEGESVILGDFNEVHSEQERFGTTFNALGATTFNHFISLACLVDLPLESYSFTWSHKSASKMSKLYRFLISEGLLSVFPSLSAICLDKHISDHRAILMHEVVVDYGPTLFRIFHSWFSKPGFDKLVKDSWSNSTFEETNNISLLKKKFQALKASIKSWCKEEKQQSTEARSSILSRL
ncbi:RNA-directed DNA polymerase, eukaryota, partial [Tanacetum coccineum]